MPNPRIVEGYQPGIDDESSFTSYNVVQDNDAAAAPPPGSFPMTPLKPRPVLGPPPPGGAASSGIPVPTANVVTQQEEDEEMPSGAPSGPQEYSTSNDPPQSSSSYPGASTTSKTPQATAVQENDNSNKKWLKYAIAGLSIVLLVIVVIVFSILLARDKYDDGDSDGNREIPSTQPILTTDELRRAVTAVLTGNGVSQITQTYGGIALWDVSQIQDFSSLFDAEGRDARAATFNEDISQWNVSQGTTFEYMFRNAQDFNVNLDRWEMKNAANLRGMFQNATRFSHDLCAWGDHLPSTAVTTQAFAGTACPRAEAPIDLTAVTPGPLCYACGTLMPTAAPTLAPTEPKKCFASGVELTFAVDSYLTQPDGSLTADTYGHPIGSWVSDELQRKKRRGGRGMALFLHFVKLWLIVANFTL